MHVESIAEEFDVLLSQSLRRTSKLLVAINRGAEILAINWLTESARANKLLPTEEYILKDEEMEKRWDVTISEVLRKVKNETRGVFHGMSFFLSKGIVPEYAEMKAIIETGGGNVVSSPSKTAVNVFNDSTEKSIIALSKKQGFAACKADHIVDAVISRKFDLRD
eukprot:TRINITY_DN11944_c0_g1_i3.p2 TRINITY_DN11944_c0_g1~~TRINITY_DN11944_c0_g1_i3.p2  ORF type:complete len:165 (-),score=50.21 TRINITY_DN11944_c0_g1_i3:43-537(-)